MRQLFKFAGAVLDCYDDPTFVDSVHAKTHFGKTLVHPEKVDELPDSAFAVKIASSTGYKRRFPIYNEAATLTSKHYFDMLYDELPEEIQKSAGFHIGKACDKYAIKKTAALEKNAEEVSRIVEYVTVPARETMLNGSQLTKMAEFRLACELPKMALENRTKAATELHKQAGDALSRQDVWDYVAKPVAGPLLDGCLDDRESILLKEASSQDQLLFSTLRDQIEEMSPADAVDTLLAFDKYANLDARYRGGLIDPYIAVYGGWSTPVSRHRNQEWIKEASEQLIDATTNSPLTKEAAQSLSIEQHVFNLSKQFPKGSSEFKKEASAPLNENIEEKWGNNYVEARRIYFGV